ncbi:RHS repeat-associated core domain-containing protein, partial [Paenibacillus apiarius]
QYYLRARFYNPVIARFTQEDEYRGDGLNLYAYVGNNPINYVDPSGYSKKCGGGGKKEGPFEETVEVTDKLGENPPRKRVFNQAKIDAGIPTSASPVKQAWVNANNAGKTGEPMKVYKFIVKEKTGFAEKYIIEHRNDPNGRGLHFHVADTKYTGQDLFENGQRYKNLGKDPNFPNIQGHYPEHKKGFKEGRK